MEEDRRMRRLYNVDNLALCTFITMLLVVVAVSARYVLHHPSSIIFIDPDRRNVEVPTFKTNTSVKAYNNKDGKCEYQHPELYGDLDKHKTYHSHKTGRANAADTLVLYSYFTGDARRRNAQFFIDNSYAPKTDFIFIDSGCSADFTKLHLNTTKMPWWRVYQRKNVGYDFCSWSEMLAFLKNSDPKRFNKYKYFILLNASVRGPFLPPWMYFQPSDQKQMSWKDIFVNQITSESKLIGTTVNCYLNESDVAPLRKLHLQSMFLVTDRAGIDIFNKEVTQCIDDKQQVINSYEIGLTQAFIQNGYNVVSQEMFWLNHDFRNHDQTVEKCKKTAFDGFKLDENGERIPVVRYNINNPDAYFGTSIHPLESIFHKTTPEFPSAIRNLYSKWINEFTKP